MALRQIQDIQQFSNGYLPKNGQVFIGDLGSADPYNNQIQVTTDSGETYSGIFDLSFNGRPLDPALGIETNLFVDDTVYTGYSLQISDADGNELFPSPWQIEF